MKLTQKRLKEVLNYDPETGIFTWKVAKAYRIKTGDVAGFSTMGNRVIRIDNKNYLAHRLVFLYVDGFLPLQRIGHKDGDNLNNRRDNLREVSYTNNTRKRSISSRNKSGVMGVSWCKVSNKWKVQIAIPKKKALGYFDNLLDAAKARWDAEVKYGFPTYDTPGSAYHYLKEQGK